MIETALEARPDLAFHVLTNGQHFEAADIERLRNPLYRAVQWGIPLYAADARLHDEIVGKVGAFERLRESFAHLIMAGAGVELRTVVLTTNYAEIPALADYVSARLGFIDVWSIMQLENIGFAKNRWPQLYVRHAENFQPIADALEQAALFGVRAQLFNFPRCTVPAPFRISAVASISDWKRKYMPARGDCRSARAAAAFSNGTRRRTPWQEYRRYDGIRKAGPVPDPKPFGGGYRRSGRRSSGSGLCRFYRDR